MKSMSQPASRRALGGALLGGFGLLSSIQVARAALPPQAVSLGRLQEFLRAPSRLATDAQGRIYVADTRAGRAVVLDAFGGILTVREGLAGPLGIAVDSQGQVYLAEKGLGRVAVYDAAWNLVSQLGQGEGEFALPNYIAIDAAGATPTIYVTDSPADEVKVYREGTLVSRFGRRGNAAGQFNFPAGLFFSPAGELFVVDQNNDRVQVFNRSNAWQRSFTLRPPGTSGRSGRSQGIAGDSEGRVYVADLFQGHLKVFEPAGVFLAVLGSYGAGPGQFRTPAGLVVDGQNRLLVASVNNRRVEVLGLDCHIQLSTTPGGQAVSQGETVTFSAAASCGGPFSYQWRRGGIDLADDGRISGATGPILTVNGVMPADAGNYAVRLTDGSGSILSPEATLLVLTTPRIVTGPSGVYVLQGTPATFTVAAEGGLLSYQWLFNGVEIAGATSSTLVVEKVQPADAGAYSVMVSNQAGSVTSSEASLRVFLAPVITLQPESQTVPEKAQVTFTAGVGGSPPIRYQWHFNDTPLTLTATPTLVLDNVNASQSGDYYLVATNLAGKATSEVAVLTVVADTTAPRLLAAEGGRADSTTISVLFSERLEPVSAQRVSNYQLLGPGDLAILGAALNSDSNVLLTLSGPRTPNANYTLRVKDLTDTAFTPNQIDPNPSTVLVSSLIRLIPINNHPWKYYQTTQVPGLDGQPWRLPTYNDQAWPQGGAIFYGNRTNSVFQPNPNPNIVLPLILQAADPANSQAWTILNVFTNAGNNIQEVTYYFRVPFDFPAQTEGAQLLIHTMIDDGAALYLNGQELERVRMAAAPATLSYSTFATGNGGQSWEPALANPGRALPAAALQTGGNLLAVELHQVNVTSSDVTLGVILEAVVLDFDGRVPEPAASLSPAGDVVIQWDGTGVQLQSAPDPAGPWTTLTGATSPFTVPRSAQQATRAQFFRLRRGP